MVLIAFSEGMNIRGDACCGLFTCNVSPAKLRGRNKLANFTSHFSYVKSSN
jgi:hypothetical protein